MMSEKTSGKKITKDLRVFIILYYCHWSNFAKNHVTLL